MAEKESPAPYNPAERIKRHLKRKSSTRALGPVFDSISRNLFEEPTTESCPAPLSTHSNPFKIGSPQKKRRPPPTPTSSQFEWEDENAVDQFASVPTRTSPRKRMTPKKSPKKSVIRRKTSFSRMRSFDTNSLLKEYHATDFSELTGSSSKVEEEVVVKESTDAPKDLRLGTKMRISTSQPFSWMKNRSKTGMVAVRIPSNERYDGLKYYLDTVSADGSLNTAKQASPLSILESATLYWQFPILPAVPMYPRIHGLEKKADRVPMSSLVLETVNNQWVEAFEQLFSSWKKGDRESFYVATAAFNVLFTKTEESDATGIEYELAGKPKKLTGSGSFSNLPPMGESNQGPLENSNISSGSLEDDFEVEDDDPASDENESPTKANQKWLKDLGVSPRNVMKSIVKRRLGPLSSSGNGVECVLVKGSSVQALYNMLQTSSLVHETTGPYTKVPPTLFASTPFLYGQILSLSKSSNVIQKAGKSLEFILELDNGPVLPHMVDLMVEFLRSGGHTNHPDGATIRVNDRHANNGMNTISDKYEPWTTISVHDKFVKWN